MSVEKSGKSHKDAQRICAIQYYKKHGKTPTQDDEKAATENVYEPYEEQLFKALDAVGPSFVDVASIEDQESYVAAVWTAKFVNDLPDSCFLYISPGGKKDSGGKTTPRSLRHLPFKDSSGKVDLPHLRNAIARIPQMKGISESLMKSLQNKARRMLSKHGTAAEVSLRQELSEIESKFMEKFNNSHSEYPKVQSTSDIYVRDVFDTYLICCLNPDEMYQVGYSRSLEDSGEYVFDAPDKWIEVEQTYTPVVKD